MATREELADTLAGFALFADLGSPQLLSVAGLFEEAAVADGERVLRQGLTGSGFYVILDGTADVCIDGTTRGTLHRGDFFGEVSILLGEPPTADVVATSSLSLPRARAGGGQAVPARPSPGDVPDDAGTGPSPAQRQSVAELIVEAVERPFPPGEYPVVVIGSGPGGLQLSYGLRRHGVEHAVLSADDGPGGMFLRWPFFQRLLSWTKPHAPAALGTREYQRYDWNSLLADEPGAGSIQAEFLDATSYFPSRPAMQQNLEAFAERAGITVRYGTRWERTRREEGPDGDDLRRRDERRGVPLPDPGAGGRHRAAVQPGDARDRARPPLRGDPRRLDLRRQARVHHRQAEQRLRARHRARLVGVVDHRLLAVAGQDQRPDQVARRGPGALRPAVRGCVPGARRADPRREDHRAHGGRRRDPRGPPAHGHRRTDVRRGRRGDRRDRLHLPAAGPAGAGCRDLRRQPAARGDAVLGEHDGARHLLRRDDQPGRAGAAQARRPGQLGRRPRPSLQQPRARPPHRGALVRARRGAARRGARRPGRLPAAGGDARARAVAPEGVPRPGGDGWPRTARSATRASCRWPTSSTG